MDIALRLPDTGKIVQEAFWQHRTPDFEIDRPVQAWRWMTQTRTLPEQRDWVRPAVADAWRRCLEDYQLPLGHHGGWQRLRTAAASPGPRTQQVADAVAELGRQFRVFLQEAGVMMVVAAPDGGVLQTLGESLLFSPAMRKLSERHSRWAESVLGNNGIGSAALLKQAVAFQGMEHFFSLLHPYSTVGYPLADESGELLAVVGLVADRQESMNSLFAFLHLLCVVLNTNLPLTRSPAAQVRILEQIPFKLAKKTADASSPAVSQPLSSLLEKAVKLQQHKIPILITGESGVGKDHFVNLLKQAGSRREQALVAINCASIPHDLIESELFGYEAGSFTGARSGGKPGKFLLANGGMLFLDEIGDMSLDLQATLLRVLETSEFTPVGGSKPIRVDVQIVAATNVPLLEAVEAGRFRRDLYYRLNGAQIHLPALRQRADKHALIQQIVQRELAGLPNAQTVRICPSVLRLIEQHPWPGNIRQLINVVRATLCTAKDDLITQQDLPADFVAEGKRYAGPAGKCGESAERPGQAVMTLEDWERHGIKATLQACSGNISLAAKTLGITRTTLYKKIGRFGLEVERVAG